MPRGAVRVIIEREVRCAVCGAPLDVRKDKFVLWVEPCTECRMTREHQGGKI